MFAIIRSGNRQYRVAKGDRIQVERLAGNKGDEIELTDILMVSDGDEHKVGPKSVGGATVKARVLGEQKGKKVLSFDYRNKHRRRTTHGHRQIYTNLEILDIVVK